MQPNEICHRKNSYARQVPALNIENKGKNQRMCLNGAARAAMGFPSHVRYYMDADRNAVALIPTNDPRGAYKVTQYGQFCARSFIMEHGLSAAMHLPLERDGDKWLAKLGVRS